MALEGGGPMEGIQRLAYSGGSNMEVATLDDPAADFLATQPFPVHALGPAKGLYGFSPRWRPWLKANLGNYDGVVVHGLWQYHGFGSYPEMLHRIPYAVFPHGMLDPYFRSASPFKHAYKQLYWALFENRLLRGARAVCFTTDHERDVSAQTFWPHRWTPSVVSFGTTPPQGDRDQQVSRFYEAFPTLKGRRFLLFLSRMHPKKGLDLLIEGFIQASAADPELELVIAGPDPDGMTTSLKRQCEAAGLGNRVLFTGMLRDQVKFGAFRTAQAFILPSHQENFGVAVAEALACGLPVLISDKVAIAPQIAEDGAGYVELDTAEGARRLITRYVETPAQQWQAMRTQALACFEKRYHMRHTVAALNALFR